MAVLMPGKWDKSTARKGFEKVRGKIQSFSWGVCQMSAKSSFTGRKMSNWLKALFAK